MDIKKLIAQSSKEDAVRLKILNNAVVKNMRSYNSAPTEANKKNWDAAEKALGECVQALFPDDNNGSESAEDLFATKLDVWRFLKADGWEISRSRFYDHCRDGRLRKYKKTGKYTLKAVEKFAKLHLKLAATGSKINDKFDKMQEEKLETELAREKVRLDKDIHDLGVRRQKFIPRDDFELAVVARAVAFMAHLNHAVQANAPDWIDLVNGDQQRAAELVHAVSAVIETRMSDFSADAEFEVILEAN